MEDGEQRPQPSRRAVLVADDEPEIRSIVAEALEDEGYLVATAVDGQLTGVPLAPFGITAAAAPGPAPVRQRGLPAAR